MLQSKVGLLVFISIVMLTVGLFGAYAGYSVGGIDYSVNMTSPTSAIDWSWSSLNFLWSVVSMQVDDVPYFISIFFQFLSIIAIWLLVTLIRGT